VEKLNFSLPLKPGPIVDVAFYFGKKRKGWFIGYEKNKILVSET
jgi:hypothetical protein